MKKHSAIFILGTLFLVVPLAAKIKVFTIWGYEEMDNSLLEEILASPTMQRLKSIDQSGPTRYFGLVPYFSRYEHSVGVWALLKRAGAPLQEQVAGLLHDASHTAFSHLTDLLFKHDEVTHKGCYQDSIHEWFLEHMKIPAITNSHGISLAMLNPDNQAYTALERPSPHLCADRIQYNIHTGIILHRINQQEACEIVNDLHFENGQWFFATPAIARKFADLSVAFTHYFWGSEYNHAFYQLFTQAMQLAIADKLITKDDIHFGTDEKILKKLQTSKNKKIQDILKRCENIYAQFETVPYGKGEFNFKPKCRAIDPLVRTGKNRYKQLTQIDNSFKKEFETIKKWCEKGYGIVFIVPRDTQLPPSKA